ncbi:GAF and ANTAR domain-containing protein [Streptomyces sp. NPDC054863]
MTDTTDVGAAQGSSGRGSEGLNGFDLGPVHDALTDWRGLDSFLQELTVQAVRAVESADSCSVTMRRGGRLVTTASSDTEALVLDAMQYEVEAGPCVCSLENGIEEYVADTLVEQRWAPYPGLAAEHGIRSVFAAPLSLRARPATTLPTEEVRRHTVGALNLYSQRPKAFCEEREIARRFSEQAAGAVAVAERIERESEAVRDLRTAMRSRFVIDQAIGIVMARQRCPADEALAILRRASQVRNVKLRDLCGELVRQTGGKPPEPGDFVRRG